MRPIGIVIERDHANAASFAGPCSRLPYFVHPTGLGDHIAVLGIARDVGNKLIMLLLAPSRFRLAQEHRGFRYRDVRLRHDQYIRQWRPVVQKKDGNSDELCLWSARNYGCCNMLPKSKKVSAPEAWKVPRGVNLPHYMISFDSKLAAMRRRREALALQSERGVGARFVSPSNCWDEEAIM